MGAKLDAGGHKKGGAGGASPDINVTPLVDVCLVLLIIFMVMTPQMDKNAPVDLPGVNNPDPKAKNKMNPLEVTVDTRGEITVEKKPYTIEELETYLRGVKAADPGQRVTLRADKTLEFLKIRDVLAVVQKAAMAGTAFAVAQGDRSRSSYDPNSGGEE